MTRHMNGTPMPRVADDSPSWDESAEQAVLGACIVSPAARTEVFNTLTGTDFYRLTHQHLYTTIRNLADHHTPIDPTTVLGDLVRRGLFRPQSLDGPYLHTCIRAGENLAAAGYHATTVREHAQRRDIRTKLTLLTQLNTSDLSDTDVIARMMRELGALTDVVQGITTTAHRKTHLMPASAVTPRRVRWLWDTTPFGQPDTSHGRIPLNTLTIGAGEPGKGKSQFAIWLTARITQGELPGELAGEPKGVIYAAAEDSWAYTIVPRLMAAGANLDYVYRVDIADDQDPQARLTLPTDTDNVGRLCEAHGIGLFIADPLLSLIGDRVDDYRAREVRAALEPLISAADRYEFTIFGLAHFTKNGGSDPLTRLAGSGAFGQLIRAMIAFARDDDTGEFVMSLEKNNLGRDNLPGHAYTIQPVTIDTPEGPTHVSRFVLGEETEATVRKVMRDAGSVSAADRSETNETTLWLKDHLLAQGGADSLKSVTAAARQNGISRSALYRAKDKLKVVTATTGFGGGRTATWTLPDAVLDGI